MDALDYKRILAVVMLPCILLASSSTAYYWYNYDDYNEPLLNGAVLKAITLMPECGPSNAKLCRTNT